MTGSKRSPEDIVAQMRAIAVDDPLTLSEAERELWDAGVDIAGFKGRLLARIKGTRKSSELNQSSDATKAIGVRHVSRVGHPENVDGSSRSRQRQERRAENSGYFNQLDDDSSQEDLLSLIDKRLKTDDSSEKK